MNLSHLTLSPGRKYHTTITACNGAGLCTTRASDGVIPDVTPPSIGVVMDGIAGEDIDYQVHRYYLTYIYMKSSILSLL